MKQAAETSDPVARAFTTAVAQQAHAVIGKAICALIDRGVTLDAARAIVRAGIETIIEEFAD